MILSCCGVWLYYLGIIECCGSYHLLPNGLQTKERRCGVIRDLHLAGYGIGLARVGAADKLLQCESLRVLLGK